MQFRLPLSASRVVEAGASPAAAVCARLLGDLGAEVIKVEPPLTEARGKERLHIDYNKLGLTLDVSKEAGRKLLLRLIARANAVVLDGSTPITPDEVRATRSDSVIARATDERDSNDVGVQDVIAGTALAGGVLAALLRHRRSGEGALVEVGSQESAAALLGEDREWHSPPGPDELKRSAARSVLEPVSHSGLGLVQVAGPTWHFSDTPVHVRLPAPRPGEHNGYVLLDLLGLGREEAQRLVDEGVVGHIESEVAGRL